MRMRQRKRRIAPHFDASIQNNNDDKFITDNSSREKEQQSLLGYLNEAVMLHSSIEQTKIDINLLEWEDEIRRDIIQLRQDELESFMSDTAHVMKSLDEGGDGQTEQEENISSEEEQDDGTREIQYEMELRQKLDIAISNALLVSGDDNIRSVEDIAKDLHELLTSSPSSSTLQPPINNVEKLKLKETTTRDWKTTSTELKERFKLIKMLSNPFIQTKIHIPSLLMPTSETNTASAAMEDSGEEGTKNHEELVVEKMNATKEGAEKHKQEDENELPTKLTNATARTTSSHSPTQPLYDTDSKVEKEAKYEKAPLQKTQNNETAAIAETDPLVAAVTTGAAVTVALVAKMPLMAAAGVALTPMVSDALTYIKDGIKMKGVGVPKKSGGEMEEDEEE